MADRHPPVGRRRGGSQRIRAHPQRHHGAEVHQRREGLVDNSRYAGYGFECSAELVGSERTLRIGARGRSTDLDELSTLGTLSHIAEDNIERHGSAYRDELRHFVHCVASDEEPCVTGEDAIAALRLALMAERSAA